MDAALAKKLLLQPGTSVAAVGAPPEHGALFRGAVEPKRADVVMLYAVDRAELKTRLRAVAASLAARSRLWIAYPKAKKLGTDLDRNVLCHLLAESGFTPVRQIAIDETWSAMWFKA